MDFSRRQLLRTAAAGAVAGATGVDPAFARDQPAPAAEESHAVLVDTTLCIGCRKCEWACDRENRLSERTARDFEDLAVLAKRRRPEQDAFTVVNRCADPERPDRQWHVKVQCMHCVDPACASACLVGALRKRVDGPVAYEAARCIGCRYCMIACPFQIPAYEYAEPIRPRVRKCVFCASRLAEGEVPACVAICPNDALASGTRRQLLAAAHTRIRSNPARYLDHVYGEHEVGGTCWLYLTPDDFRRAGLPALGPDPIPRRTERIQHGVFKSFVPPLVLYGLLGLIMHSLRGDNGGDHREAS